MKRVEEVEENAKAYTDTAIEKLRANLEASAPTRTCPEVSKYSMTKAEYRCRCTLRLLGLPVDPQENPKDMSDPVRSVLKERLHFSDEQLEEFGAIIAVRPWSTWDQHPIEITFESHEIRDEVIVRMPHLNQNLEIDDPVLRLSSKYPLSWLRLVKKLEGKAKKIRAIKDINRPQLTAFWSQLRFTMDDEKLTIWVKKVSEGAGWMPAADAAELYAGDYPGLAEALKE